MEQISRMAAEVNKLVGSNLLEGKALYLPDVGSLYIIVNQQGAKRVDFSSSEKGASLIEVIKERAGCTAEQANEIYTRWISEVRTSESLLVIDGVGELRIKTFVALESFAKQLNPEQIKEKVMAKEEKKAAQPAPEAKVDPKAAPKCAAKKSNKAVIIVICVVLAAVGGYMGYSSGQKAKAEKARIEAIAQEKALEQQRIADSIAVAQIEAKRLAAEQAAAEAAAKGLRYKVVYGVYDLRSNVDVALKTINQQYGDGAAHEYKFGKKTLVSMFESNNRAESQKFLMEYYDLYPDAWVYDSEK